MILRPAEVPVSGLYAVAVLCCITGVLGYLPAISAVGASFSIILLNNYYASVTTSDLEVLPYVVGMWTFAVLPASLTVPLVAELQGIAPPNAPTFPFRLLQIYLCSMLFVNGILKVPFWREWVTEKGVFHDTKNWNAISPYVDTYWPLVADSGDIPYLWAGLGVLTIVIEVGAAIPLFYPPAVLLVWPGLVGLLVGNHLLRSTSFLLLPPLYLTVFLPWVVEVFV